MSGHAGTTVLWISDIVLFNLALTYQGVTVLISSLLLHKKPYS